MIRFALLPAMFFGLTASAYQAGPKEIACEQVKSDSKGGNVTQFTLTLERLESGLYQASVKQKVLGKEVGRFETTNLTCTFAADPLVYSCLGGTRLSRDYLSATRVTQEMSFMTFVRYEIRANFAKSGLNDALSYTFDGRQESTACKVAL